MKSLITLLVSLLLLNSASAQHQTKDVRYKKYAGHYGNTSGISLFEDGTYLLYGYATGVFGTYKFEKDYLLFYPDQQELFEVFAHQNPALRDSTRINFLGFERGGKTFAKFDQDSLRKVFNDDVNCLNAPFVYQKAGQTKNIILSRLPEEAAKPNVAIESSRHYHNASGYNDFILVHNAPKREYEDFSAMIIPAKTGDVIKLSNYGGDEGYPKQNKEEQARWKEILEWKSQYDQSKGVKKNEVYANKHYNTFPEPDSSKYHYDSRSNQYTDSSDQENSAYYKQNQYNDPRYLRKYIKLQPETKLKFSESNLANKSIFFSVCGEGSEHSYHYKGFEKYEEENPQMPQNIEPVKIKDNPGI
ncbi:preprotein translocase subunit SecD [Pedobacter sp. PLR]|uniref:preprotein translocase subunit SecD n=1 Tax=Pedobacter sp. PLR TaxID=2994465 RepID=UPI0022486035|nr:preprotein translocase subunit SecD [Pedobacter sp. PLR]MCX2454191.1 preprotein translocase subunit SecD [Pedobacter sp. PLR]